MADAGGIIVVGGSSGLGRALADHYAQKGWRVTITSRSQEKAEKVAAEIDGEASGIALDLTEPHAIASQLSGVGNLDRVVVVAVERDTNTAADFDIEGASRLMTMKLIGYVETIHALLPKLSQHASILLFGGLAKDRPYPGGLTIGTVNGGITGMVTSLALELAPIRVNAIHPAIVGDSPFWENKPAEVLEGFRSRTPIGRLITTSEVVDACEFLLENGGMNGFHLNIDGGWLLT